MFKPDYTPVEMLRMGVFGKSYFAGFDDFSGYTTELTLLVKQNIGKFNTASNHFKAKAGQHYDVWMANGWIFDEDPIGWFQWYCRYSSGRRHLRDDHQIKRYNSYRARWLSRANNDIARKGDTSNVIKQGLLQWAIKI